MQVPGGHWGAWQDDRVGGRLLAGGLGGGPDKGWLIRFLDLKVC